MPRFEGCIEAREISLCPKTKGGGANQHAHVLMLKSMGAKAPQPEKTPMPAAQTEAEKAAEAQAAAIQKAARDITNKVLSMNDVTKAHYLALDDAGQAAFLQKSAEDMTKEAETAKAAADKKVAEEEAAKSGKTVEFVELQKKYDAQQAEIETLKAGRVEDAIQKRAETEFAGFPGGAAAVVPLLKAYATLPEDARVASEAVLKAQANTAKSLMVTYAGRTEEDISKAAGAQARIDAAVAKAREADPKLTQAAALEKVSEMREHADDVALIAG